MSTTRIMVDLETFGTAPGSVIVAIGAVKFECDVIDDGLRRRGSYSAEAGVISPFYYRVCPQSCVDAGMTMDAATVQWWLRQGDAARREVADGGSPLKEVLEEFAEWVGDENAEMWGNGAAFDNVLLRRAYELAGIECPWLFRNDRCYRTMKALYPHVKAKHEGVGHHAGNDAYNQTIHLMAIFREMEVENEKSGAGRPGNGLGQDGPATVGRGGL